MSTVADANEKPDAPDEAAFASERVADHLRQMILDDQLLPGERIRQDAVAAELGAGRLPVRRGGPPHPRGRGRYGAERTAVRGLAPRLPRSARPSTSCVSEVEPLVLAESIPNLQR